MQRPDSVLLDQFEFVAFVAFHYRVFDLPLELKSIVLKKKNRNRVCHAVYYLNGRFQFDDPHFMFRLFQTDFDF